MAISSVQPEGFLAEGPEESLEMGWDVENEESGETETSSESSELKVMPLQPSLWFHRLGSLSPIHWVAFIDNGAVEPIQLPPER